MKDGDTVKAVPDSGLHLASRLRSGEPAVMSLRCAPVLLDEVELAVVLGVEVADMAAPLDQLFEL